MSLISLLVVTLILGVLSVVVLTHIDGGSSPCAKSGTTTTIVPGVNPQALTGGC